MNFYKDKRFYIPILFFLILEVLLQLGLYVPFLRKNSYAANVNRILHHVQEKQKEHDPDILILGTSVAYQGLSMKAMNESMGKYGYKVQSIAIPGSELLVQELATEKVLRKFKKVKLLIHVMEVTMPWVQATDLSIPTLAMISEFNRIQAAIELKKFYYQPSYEDYGFVLIRSIAYRRDLRHFLLAPGERMKHYFRALKNPNTGIADFENDSREKISHYPLLSIEDCIKKTNPANGEVIPVGSNYYHKKALYDTCLLAKNTTKEFKKNKSTELYFKRLKYIYDRLKKENIRIINVMAPYSDLIEELNKKERFELWKEELGKMNGAKAELIDLQDIFLPEKNGDYFYDLIHLNHYGMIRFTEHLNQYLEKNINRLMKD
ncbi:MAG: SGNH/GDSL hydrolase family protein [Leptospiraceae bacterium]|nr:SGNH/GDSL hydrolase family protein [Leptospiraceae bacterium]MCP5502305.1 SGNH/GDSL hydrolase family protein [Leptospiraceae bacterium]